MNVSENSGFSPKSSILNRCFRYFNHPFWGIVFPLFLVQHPYTSGVFCGISAPTLQELMSLGGEAFSTWQGEISAILEQVGKGHEERSPRLGFVGRFWLKKGRVRVGCGCCCCCCCCCCCWNLLKNKQKWANKSLRHPKSSSTSPEACTFLEVRCLDLPQKQTHTKDQRIRTNRDVASMASIPFGGHEQTGLHLVTL